MRSAGDVSFLLHAVAVQPCFARVTSQVRPLLPGTSPTQIFRGDQATSEEGDRDDREDYESRHSVAPTRRERIQVSQPPASLVGAGDA